MLICYARSSSLKEIEYCEQKYFINYNLGIKEPPNKKAVLGTMTHKVLEWLALCKLHQNDTNIITFFDDSLKEQITISKSELYSTSCLEDNTIAEINKTRRDKSIYKTNAQLNSGHQRVGYALINKLIIKSFEYYADKYSYDWTTTDLKNCGNWVWMALEWNNGYYDPRNLNIISPEQEFDITIDAPWSDYEYVVDGEKIAGKFAIKGTVDLICAADSDTIEIVDWKTGQRYDWAKGEEKTYDKICNDVQLSLYHYAVSKLYPQYKHVILTIFYIRDGGPFTVSFDSDNVENIERTLREHFELVRSTKLPKMLSRQQSDFRCTKLCSYYKNNWPGTEQNICRFINNEIKRVGMDTVIEKYKQSGHSIGKYHSPGE